MGLSAILYVVDSDGNRVDPPQSDGTYLPTIIKLGDNLTGTATNAGSTVTVDISATGADANAVEIQGRPVPNVAPSTNQPLTWNGSAWIPATPDAANVGYSAAPPPWPEGAPDTVGPALDKLAARAAIVLDEWSAATTGAPAAANADYYSTAPIATLTAAHRYDFSAVTHTTEARNIVVKTASNTGSYQVSSPTAHQNTVVAITISGDVLVCPISLTNADGGETIASGFGVGVLEFRTSAQVDTAGAWSVGMGTKLGLSHPARYDVSVDGGALTVGPVAVVATSGFNGNVPNGGLAPDDPPNGTRVYSVAYFRGLDTSTTATAVLVAGPQVNLSWSALPSIPPAAYQDGWEVWRADGTLPYVGIASNGPGTLTLADTDIVSGHTYHYAVRCTFPGGGVGAMVNPVTVVVP